MADKKFDKGAGPHDKIDLSLRGDKCGKEAASTACESGASTRDSDSESDDDDDADDAFFANRGFSFLKQEPESSKRSYTKPSLLETSARPK